MGQYKYTKEMLDKMTADYTRGVSVAEISASLEVPERSVIAKLSALGIYKKKEYLNKRGERPIKKEEYIERISKLLDINTDLLESLEKVTKTALMLMDKKISLLKETIENSDIVE